MKPEAYTVSQYLELLNIYLRREQVSIVGEVVEYKPGAKWVGFTLKDKEDSSVLKCVLSAWEFKRIGVMLEVGMEVQVSGSPSISKKYGSFGFWVKHIQPVGEGALRKAYELLLKKLKEEGLFDRKRELPEFIEHIGVISSREGVVIHDFMNNLKKIGFKVSFVDARVEGEHAPGQLVAAMKTLKRVKPDVLVLIRGGGSLESMQAFNNERVCREVFSSSIPVIAGIGHDVDVPIAAMIADVVASTPTGAAHLVNETWDRVFDEVPGYERALVYRVELLVRDIRDVMRRSASVVSQVLERGIGDASLRVSAADRVLLKGLHSVVTLVRERSFAFVRAVSGLGNVVRQLQDQRHVLGQRIVNASERVIEGAQRSVVSAERIINLGNPERNLSLGYSIVFSKDGAVVKDAKKLKKGDELTTRLAGGSISSTVTNTRV